MGTGRRGLPILAVATVYVALAACSGSGGGRDAGADGGGMDADMRMVDGGGMACVPGTGASTTQTIGPEGGTISFEVVTLTFPPGALASDTAITVTSTLECPYSWDGTTPESPIYRFEPAGLTFERPAQLTLSYPGPAHGAFLNYTNELGDFEIIADSVDGSAVTAEITHFSLALLSALGPGYGNDYVDFQAVSPEIEPGDPFRLLLATNHLSPRLDCTADHGLGPAAWMVWDYSDGRRELVARFAVSGLTDTTTYTATCTGVGGGAGVTVAATVTVRPDPTLSFAASRTVVHPGDPPVELAWSGSADLEHGCLIYARFRDGRLERFHTLTLAGIDGPPLAVSPTHDTRYVLQCFRRSLDPDSLPRQFRREVSIFFEPGPDAGTDASSPDGGLDAGTDAAGPDAGPDAASPCPPGRVTCPGGCVDLRTSNMDCGACGSSCPAEQFCFMGVCTNMGSGCQGMPPGYCTPSGLSCRATDISEMSRGVRRCCNEVGGSCDTTLPVPGCCGLMTCAGGECVCLSSGSYCTETADCCSGLVCHSSTTQQCSACYAAGVPCHDGYDCCSGTCDTSGTTVRCL